MEKLVSIEDQLGQMKSTHPDAENYELPTEFKISSKTLSNIEILEDAPFELGEWEGEHKEN